MARLFIFAIIVWFAYFVAKSIWRGLFPSSSPGTQDNRSDSSEAELIRDPQCGAYFLRTKGVKGVVEGKVVHFCSEQCYDKYLERVKDKG